MATSELKFSQFKSIILITTTVYSFSSMSNAFFLMGYAAIPWYLIAATCFFIPYAFIISEYTATFKDQPGGLYTWLKHSVSEQVAFIATFLWYSSYLVWLVSLFMKLWIPLTVFLFGKDLAQSTESIFGLKTQHILGIFSIIALLFITKLVTKGFKKVQQMMMIGGSLILVLVLLAFAGNLFIILMNKGQFAEPLVTSSQFIDSPNPHYSGFLGSASFFIFGITAFGGLDTVASMVDNFPNAKKQFPNAILVSSFLIAILYLCGLFLWGGSMNWQTLFAEKKIHLGNAMYFLMENLGYQISQSLHLSPYWTTLLATIFIRLTGFSLFFTYVGLLSSIVYAPLNALLKGTPAIYWPKWLIKWNRHDITEVGMWIQCLIVSSLILLLAFGGQHITELYNQLTIMTNISRSLPYLMIAASYPSFKKNQSITKPFEILTKEKSIFLASFSVVASTSLAIGATILVPLLQQNYKTTFFLTLGPLVFSTFAFVFHKQLNKRISLL